MALDPKIVKMLNDFADSQPALRLPGEPLGLSNPKLGDALDAALDAADAENATGLAYTPAVGSDWSPVPTTGQGALDQLASRVKTAETGITTAQSTAEDAENQAYTAGTPADWATSAPTTLKAAIDRLASAVEGLLAAPIP